MRKERLKERILSFVETYLFFIFSHDLNARLRRVRSEAARTELLERLIIVFRILLWYWMSDTLLFANDFYFILLLFPRGLLLGSYMGADIAPLCLRILLKAAALLLDWKVVTCNTN